MSTTHTHTYIYSCLKQKYKKWCHLDVYTNQFEAKEMVAPYNIKPSYQDKEPYMF